MADKDIYEGCPYPHCDARILHAPSECEYCDHYSLRQHERIRDGIAFTGHEPVGNQVPCPADVARPQGSSSDHRRWGGNKPTGAVGDPTWPIETIASRIFYGDQGGRLQWPLVERVAIAIKRPFKDRKKKKMGYRREGNWWIKRI